jgi:predicted NBD/HSP70 family sugar kinase
MSSEPSSRPLRRSTGAAGHADMRAANRAVVLDLVRRFGPLSRVDVAKRSGLAKPTTSDIMEELLHEGIVFEVGVGIAGRTGGRRPVLYQFNPQAWFVVGIEIGNERTTIAVANAIGAELDRVVVPNRRRPTTAMKAIGEAVDELLKQNRVPMRSVAGTAVSIPGLVDPSSGVCVLAPNLGWRNVDIPALLEPYLPARPQVHNVIESVLFAEHLEGAAKDVDDAVMLFEADGGVGASILIAGQIYRGPAGLAGEVGHCKVPGAIQRCGCGGVGCLETEVSTRAILRRAGVDLQGASPADEMAAIVRSDEPEVIALLDAVGDQLGHAGSWLVNLINPEVVLIAGGFLDCGPHLFESAAATIRREVLPALGSAVEIRRSALGSEAGVRGLLLLALRSTEVWGARRGA